MTMEDILDTLGTQTGLPRSLLDERASLSLARTAQRFESRVLGQRKRSSASSSVAMVKAGVTDPTRPLGVFLFVGPTGTGKTEIAKTLAEFMFGSPDRMIRVDMSELSNPDSLDVLLGDRDPLGSQQALVNRIRQQPFSVVLLDEFEKAHPLVWDLFLQVFDDSRLTDRRGNTAGLPSRDPDPHVEPRRRDPEGRYFQNDKGVFTPGSVMKSGGPHVPPRVRQPHRSRDRVPAAVARHHARHPAQGTARRVPAPRPAQPRVGGRVGRVGA